jgi:hypothetical protein
LVVPPDDKAPTDPEAVPKTYGGNSGFLGFFNHVDPEAEVLILTIF